MKLNIISNNVSGRTIAATGLTAADFKQYDPITHVYKRPDTYIGSEMKLEREEWLFNITERKMYNKTVDIVPGCERLYLEILTNASDCVGRTRRAGIKPGNIDILMNTDTISITNYGLPIPVEIHPDNGLYVPEMVLGTLLSSSNFEVDERHEAGTNGIGAKATNIFSKQFMVIIHDNIRKLKYTQVWNNNMKQRSDPVIEQYNGKVGSVQIVYKMDFERFRYDPNIGYDQDFVALFARHAIDISFTAKTTVTFNGEVCDYSKIRDYARCYFGDNVDNAVVHYQWPEGTEIIKNKKYQVAKDPCITPLVELIAVDTPDEGHHVSFVNCMMTKDGGVHVNSAFKAVGDNAVNMVNEAVIKKLTKQNKGKELDAKTKRSQTININDVKGHISLLLAVKVVNPTFGSQTKTVLAAPAPKITLSEKELKPIGKWQLILRLLAALEAKQFATLSKNNGKLKRYIKLDKGVDANEAGKSKRHQCILYITEGDSGAGYLNKMIKLIPGGRDFAGVYPAKGKGLNVMNANSYQIGKNKEIAELMKLLGLEFCPEGADKNTYYLDQTRYNKLRYGGINIMADADDDGKHIIGLILNLFYCFFPSLLARGFVMYYRTPILRLSYNKQVVKFYTKREYEAWKEETPNHDRWKYKYYKGLGTSTDADIKDDYQTPRIVNCVYDDETPNAMKLAFDKSHSDQRKEWIRQWKPIIGVDDIQMQPISWFINHELILFSMADTKRSLPKLVDGFKESHRKIIAGAHTKWNINSNKIKHKEVKVAQFGAYTAEQTCYQHGETILGKVVIGMAQNYIGSNNIPWFTRDGQFGCVDPNTPILLWNKSTKLAKDITTSDILVGDDGEPRLISQIVSGRDEMYDVIQDYGITYRVNSLHILTLYMPSHKTYHQDKDGRYHVIYYDNLVKKVRRHSMNSKLEVDTILNSIPDGNIIDIDVQSYLKFSVSDKMLFKSVHNHVPINWDNNAMERLATIIDESGELITNGSIKLSNMDSDINFLAQSLGFKVEGSIISGDLARIPTKKVISNCNKPYIGSNIRVEHVGIGDYVGWYIDGNERFLLGDWTCTHNTRYENGKDGSSARYLFVRPEELVGYIIRKEDNPILVNVIDEGQQVEPESYYPIIPMILINGTDGIGTGFSSYVPCHNPLDIINWLKIKLSGDSDDNLPHLKPWYRGYTGTIRVIDRRNRKKKGTVTVTTIVNNAAQQVVTQTEETEETDNHNVQDELLPTDTGYYDEEPTTESRPLLSMISLGKFHLELNGDIVVTELPLGRSPLSYHKWLEDLQQQKKIKGFRDNSIDDTVYFKIEGYKENASHRTLKLQRTKGISNLTLLDEQNKPIRYDTALDIINAYYDIRLPIYQRRKDYILGNINNMISINNDKIRFIRAILDGHIVYLNQKKDNIYQAMDRLEIPRKIFDNTKLTHLTEEDINKLHAENVSLQQQHAVLLETTPEQMWLKELLELETVYHKIYKDVEPSQPLITNKPVITSPFPQLNIIS